MQRPLFKKLSAPIDSVLNGLDTLFNFIPFPIVILIFMAFAFKTNGLKFALLSALSLIFIDLVDLWQETMTTLAMIFTAVIFCMLIGIPLGIVASRSNLFETISSSILLYLILLPILSIFGKLVVSPKGTLPNKFLFLRYFIRSELKDIRATGPL